MTLRIERATVRMPWLGPENPLPMVNPPLEMQYTIDGAIPREIVDGSRYGNPRNLHPFREQNGYDRVTRPRELTAVVLENAHLRAVFLPELGGRLWELTDTATAKQLLHSPATIQLANLALRNAWFAGGIEWNIGTRGHSPTTCVPLHAAIVGAPRDPSDGPSGGPSGGRDDRGEALRLWEFDRLREVVFQLDAWLPDDSLVLFVSIRVTNPNPHAVPLYWWSNAAVPQEPGSRVVAPAASAFATDYGHGISRVVPTDDGGVDGTWPTANPRARDYFFDIPLQHRPWILNSDSAGDGLAMVSTPRLRGRKLFVWGEGTGGRRWQRWLSPEGGEYAEIQAGLAQTQFEHLELPAGESWSWTEAYGNARVDPALAHSRRWGAAVDHCEERVEELIGSARLAAAHESAVRSMDAAPHQLVVAGSGWGALEGARRRRQGMPWIDESATPFARATITDEQTPWLSLLEGAGFEGAGSFVAGADWERLLAAVEQNAATLAHRAVIEHAAGAEGAETLYRESLGHAPTALAHRGLALLARGTGDASGALERYRLACALEPANASLLIEAATAALELGADGTALQLIEACDESIADRGRIRMLWARACAGTGRPDEARAVLRAGIEVADLREGDNAMAALWRQLIPHEEVPAAYQFSMKADPA
jgi:tetratricopeptide (TPR) repeat protein